MAKTKKLKVGDKLQLVDEQGATQFTTYGGRKPFSLDEKWSTITHAGRLEMSKLKTDDVQIFNPAARLALWCESHLTYGNFLSVVWKDAEKDLGLTQPQVSKAKDQLTKAGFLLSDEKNKKWQIHPKFSYFGSLRKFKREREKSNVVHADFSKRRKIADATREAVRRYEANGFDIDAALRPIYDDEELFRAAEAALVKIAIETGRMPDPWYEP